jgi:hypothetical protein
MPDKSRRVSWERPGLADSRRSADKRIKDWIAQTVENLCAYLSAAMSAGADVS